MTNGHRAQIYTIDLSFANGSNATKLAASEVPRWIQQHVAQVEQWLQIVSVEHILEHKILEFLEELTASANVKRTSNTPTTNL